MIRVDDKVIQRVVGSFGRPELLERSEGGLVVFLNGMSEEDIMLLLLGGCLD